RGARGRTTRGLLTINHLAELFPGLKKRYPLRWNLDGITRFGIPPFAWIAVAYTKTPKATQLNFIPLTQGLSDTIQQNIDHSLSLLLGELNLISDLLNELCLCHAFSSPEGGIHRTAPEQCGEMVAYSHL